MTIRTAFHLRYERAQEILRQKNAVVPNGKPDSFYVNSQSQPGCQHDVLVCIDEELGWVVETACDCPDWRNQLEALNEFAMNPGISVINACPCCKHVLAAILSLGKFDVLNGVVIREAQ